MLKSIIVGVLAIMGGIGGNLISAWFQPSVDDILGPQRVLWTVIAIVSILVLVAILDNERTLALNWPWHRFWYLHEIQRSGWHTGVDDVDRRDGGQHLANLINSARLQVMLRKRRVPGAQVIERGERKDIVEVLLDVVNDKPGESHRALILGEPGAGKTTGLVQLGQALARQSKKRLGLGQPIPVLVRLSRFQESNNLFDLIAEEVGSSTKGRCSKALARGIKHLAERGRVVFLFDGLDEALGTRREGVLSQLTRLLASPDLKVAPVIITCRTREDPAGRLPGLQTFEILDLDDTAVAAFIRIYSQPGHSEEQIKKQLEKYKLLEAKGLARNPFWLRFILKNGPSEANRGQILNRAIDDLLLRELRERTDTGQEWRRVLTLDQQHDEIKQGLAWLGYRMSVQHQVELDERRALEELETWVSKQTDIADLGPREIVRLGRDAQILAYEPPQVVRFRHKLLQEFMTAWALGRDQELLLAHVGLLVTDNNLWEILFILADICADASLIKLIVTDHTALVRAVLSDRTDVRRLTIALVLLGSAQTLDRRLKEDVVSAFVDSLASGTTQAHQQIAIDIAKIAKTQLLQTLAEVLQEGERIAREAIIDILCALARERAVENDAIAMLIAHLPDQKVGELIVRGLKDIGGATVEPLIAALRDHDPLIRAGAANALGEIKDERAVEPLIAALRDYNNRVQEKAAYALGAIGDIRAVKPLVAALGDDSYRVRAGAVDALGKMGAAAVEPLIAVLGDQKRIIGVGAVDALGKIGAAAVEPLIAALEGSNYSVQTRVANALGKIRDTRAVEPLIAALLQRYDDDIPDGVIEVRIEAARALGEIGDGRAVEPLHAALEDENERVQRTADKALDKIRNR